MLDIQGLFNCVSATAGLLTQLLYFVFRASHSIGYLIVSLTYTCIIGVCSACETLVLILNVLYEDYCIFIVDLFNKIIAIISSVGYLLSQSLFCLQNCWNGFKGFVTLLYQSFELYFGALFSVLMKIIYFIGSIPELVKHALILIGSSIWYIIWLVPLSILYSFTLLIYLAGRSYEELYSLTFTILEGLFQIVVNIVLTFLDFPLEALLGLCAGVLLGVGLYKYSSHITHYGIYCISYARQHIRRIPMQMRRGVLWLITELFSRHRRHQNMNNSTSSEDSFGDNTNLRRRPVSSSRSSEHPYRLKKQFHKQLSNDQESNLCIVCQDAEKCVVIFPCRHVCLCKPCCIIIQRGPCECPICRAPMRSTMSVFL
ncbi:uncharacterized protein [Anabrus simplex]|uniref:uncharacterized protein n=1 Tax=Anabrus simplex TaxID=316456 RepID=UPI0034DCD0D7